MEDNGSLQNAEFTEYYFLEKSIVKILRYAVFLHTRKQI